MTSTSASSWKPTAKQIEAFLTECGWSKKTDGMPELWRKISSGESLIAYHRQPGTYIRNVMRIIGIKQSPIQLDGNWQTMARHVIAKIMGKPVPEVALKAEPKPIRPAVDLKAKAAKTKFLASIAETRQQIKDLEAKIGKPEALKQRDHLKSKLAKLLVKRPTY